MDFLNCCLRLDSSKRKTWAELLTHPFLLNLRSFNHCTNNRESVHIDIRQTVNFQEHFNNHLIQKIEKRINKFKKIKEEKIQKVPKSVQDKKKLDETFLSSSDSKFENEHNIQVVLSTICIVMLIILVSLLWNL